jgi:hypothetical protein
MAIIDGVAVLDALTLDDTLHAVADAIPLLSAGDQRAPEVSAS